MLTKTSLPSILACSTFGAALMRHQSIAIGDGRNRSFSLNKFDFTASLTVPAHTGSPPDM